MLIQKAFKAAFICVTQLLSQICDEPKCDLFDKLLIQCIYITRHSPRKQPDTKRRKLAMERNLLSQLENTILTYVSKLINLMKEHLDSTTYIVAIMKNNEKYKTFLTQLGPICSIADEYLIATDYGFQEGLAHRAESWLLESLANEQGEYLEQTLNLSLNNIRKSNSSYSCLESLCSFLRGANEVSLKLKDEKGDEVSVPEFYRKNLSKYVGNVKIGVDDNYLHSLKKCVRTETQIASNLSSDLAEESRMLIMEHTLLNNTVLRNVLRQLIFYASNRKGHLLDTIELYSIFCRCNHLLKLKTTIVECIVEYFGRILDMKQRASKVEDLGHLIDFFEIDLGCLSPELRKLSETVRNEFRNRSENKKYIQRLVKKLDVFFKHTYKTGQTVGNSDDWILTIPKIVTYMGMESEFVSNYLTESFLRRAIIMSSKFLQVFCNRVTECSERKFCERLSTDYRDEATNLIKLIRDLDASFRLSNGNGIEYPRLAPLVLEAHAVPLLYHDKDKERFPIPKSLAETWLMCLKSYQLQDALNRSKKVRLVNKLNKVEVSSPFSLPSGEKISLELNLVQSAVLELFNTRLRWPFDDVVREFGATDSRLLKRALFSFC